jgi:hypothetical protein
MTTDHHAPAHPSVLGMAMDHIQVRSTKNPIHKKIVRLNLTPNPTRVQFSTRTDQKPDPQKNSQNKFDTQSHTHECNLAPEPVVKMGQPTQLIVRKNHNKANIQLNITHS